MADDHHLRVGKNGLDPLTDTGPDAGKVLYERINVLCREFALPDVVNASTNILLNVMRQRNETRDAAERDFNEMFGRVKAILMEHYNGPGGKRRNIFPFHQTIHMPLVSLKDKK